MFCRARVRMYGDQISGRPGSFTRFSCDSCQALAMVLFISSSPSWYICFMSPIRPALGSSLLSIFGVFGLFVYMYILMSSSSRQRGAGGEREEGEKEEEARKGGEKGRESKIKLRQGGQTHSLASFSFFSMAVRQDQSLVELFFKVTITVPLFSYTHTHTCIHMTSFSTDQ